MVQSETTIDRELVRELETERLLTIGALASGISHQVGNPIASIVMALGRLRDELTESEQKETVTQVIERADYITRTLRALSEYAPAPTDKQAPINANHEIERVTAVSPLHSRLARVSLKTELNPDIPVLWGRPGAISQLVMTMLNRALECAPSAIVIRTRPAPEGLEIGIEATHADPAAPSAPAGGRNHCDTNTPVEQPLIASRIVEMFHGRMAVQNGDGVSVTISLPAQTDQPEAPCNGS